MTLLNHVGISLSQSLIEQAEKAYAEGDLKKAVDNAWEAASTALRAIAERRGWEFDSPTEMFATMDKLYEETNQPDIDLFFQVAFIAPYNFREGWTDNAESVGYDLQAVKKLLAMLEGIE